MIFYDEDEKNNITDNINKVIITVPNNKGINANKVKLIIDSKLRDKILLFHPDGNTKTLAIRFNNFVKFIKCEEHKCIYI